jgi:hypothetical protein
VSHLHDTSISPAASVAGTHPNPTHVSNTFRPGTTFNTAAQAQDGAHLHGPPPPAYKEGTAVFWCHTTSQHKLATAELISEINIDFHSANVLRAEFMLELEALTVACVSAGKNSSVNLPQHRPI